MSMTAPVPVKKTPATPATPYLCRELFFKCQSEDETAALAAVLARFAVPRDLICLNGDLGAGKSTFARAFLRALGHDGDVPSPTYTLVQFYATPRINVAHVDCYRLNTPEELDGLGLETYREHGIILSEWSEKGGALLATGQADFLNYHINNPDNGGTLEIFFEPVAGQLDQRAVRLVASPGWQRRFGLAFASIKRPTTVEGRQRFLESIGLGDATMEAFPGDWSGRSYARVTLASGEKRILMDSPPPWEGTEDFVAVAGYYRSLGLHAPEIYAEDGTEGYLLLEDLGGTRLLDRLDAGQPVEDWYRTAVEALGRMAHSAPMTGARHYAPRDWWAETTRWIDWYFPLATGRAATLTERAEFQALWAPLYDTIMHGPQGTLLWDYQATNMMVLGEDATLANFGLIDFQDARTAPVAQDLAILLRDIRRGQDDELEAHMLDHAARLLPYDRQQLQQAVEIANLHHCVRIIGGLARAWLRDGNRGGAERFMQRTWQVARQSYACPALTALVAFISPYETPGLTRLEEQGA